MQNIPRSDISIKPMFRAPKASEIVKEFDTSIALNMYDEVETQQGWVKAKELKIQDSLLLEDGVIGKIVNIIGTNNKIQLEVNCA